MKVSIIVPTYNEERVIGDCLESLSKQTYKDLEIIVVDDGSTDGTLENIKSIVGITNNTGTKTKLLQQDHKGPGSARNLGAVNAAGDILAFVDSDMTFEQDFIEKLVEPIVKGKAKGTFSKEEYVKNNDNVWAKCWGINEGWEEGKRHPKSYPDKQKVFRAILKSEFDKVGGFSPIGYTDDWTLSEKLGYEAVTANGAKFYHKNPDSLGEILKQAEWIGKRKYKLGKIGSLIAVLRASLPISLLSGFAKSVIYKKPKFVIFKVVYDFGVMSGAIESILGGNCAK